MMPDREIREIKSHAKFVDLQYITSVWCMQDRFREPTEVLTETGLALWLIKVYITLALYSMLTYLSGQ